MLTQQKAAVTLFLIDGFVACSLSQFSCFLGRFLNTFLYCGQEVVRSVMFISFGGVRIMVASIFVSTGGRQTSCRSCDITGLGDLDLAHEDEE